MLDGPAIAAIAFVLAWFIGRGMLARLERRRQLIACAALLSHHLAHWRYPSHEWQRHCERMRRELWLRCLLLAARLALPALILIAMLCILLEAHVDLAPGLVTAIVVALGTVTAALLLGPPLWQFTRLSLRKRLDYEVYVGEPGVLEVWWNGTRIETMEGHLYADAGGAIERVKASGVEPAEIVFSVGQPMSWGVMHREEHFLVPQGHLVEARAVARKLTARGSQPG